MLQRLDWELALGTSTGAMFLFHWNPEGHLEYMLEFTPVQHFSEERFRPLGPELASPLKQGNQRGKHRGE